MSERVAFECSPQFAAAIIARCAEIDKFNRDVVHPTNERLRPNAPVWARPGWDLQSDRRCIGFADDTSDQPPAVGLSRAKSRTHLVPARGKAGQRWRDVQDAMNKRPTLEPVFRAHGVDASVMDLDNGRVTTPGICLNEVAGRVWLIYGKAPLMSDVGHLVPCKLSEFHAACEQMDATGVPS